MILGRHESIQASATWENASNKVKRNQIRLVNPDEVPSVKGEGVDEEVVKKDFEEASTAINIAIDSEVSWLRVDGRGALEMPNSDALDSAVRQSKVVMTLI